MLGELPWALPAVRLPRDMAPQSKRSVMRRLRDALAEGCVWRRAWAAERLRCVLAPVPTLARCRFGMAAATRDADCAMLRSKPAAWRAQADAGLDLRRIKAYWKVPLVGSPMDHWSSVVAKLEEFAQVVRRSRPLLRASWQEVALPALLQAPRIVTPEFRAHCRPLPAPLQHEVAIIEDKDTSAGWLMNREAYQRRSLQCLEREGAWLRTKLSGMEAARRIAASFRDEALGHFASRCYNRRWLEGLPTLYTTQKCKCWTSGAHVCRRPGHSCQRRIASWAAFPCRLRLRRIGRAWRVTLIWLPHGDATCSLASRCPAAAGAAGVARSAPRSRR